MTEDEPVDSVAFQLADLEDGDVGTAYLTRNRVSGDVQNAGYEIQWLGDDDYPEKVEVNNLDGAGTTSASSSAFETKTFTRGEGSAEAEDADELEQSIFGDDTEIQMVDTSGVEPQLLPSIPSWVPSIPSPSDLLDAFGDVLSDLSDAVNVSQDLLADMISAAIENAQDTTVEDIVITSTSILVDTKQGLIALVDEFQDSRALRAIWRLRVGFVDTLYSLGTSGALEELADDNYDCGGCIAVITITVGVGLGATAGATCTALGIGTLGWGGVACTAFFGAVFSYGETILLSEAQDICSGSHTPTSVNVC